MRQGDWIETYTGKQFWPLDPRHDEVALEDIAHALSLQARFAGHTWWPYSVAQHSLNCLGIARNYSVTDLVTLFWILMHDAAEAYITDLPRPIKRFMGEFKEIELKIETVIWQHFGVQQPSKGDFEAIKFFDNLALGHEGRCLMRNTQNWAGNYVSLSDTDNVCVLEQPWSAIKQRFMSEAQKLLDEIGKEKAGVNAEGSGL